MWLKTFLYVWNIFSIETELKAKRRNTANCKFYFNQERISKNLPGHDFLCANSWKCQVKLNVYHDLNIIYLTQLHSGGSPLGGVITDQKQTGVQCPPVCSAPRFQTLRPTQEWSNFSSSQPHHIWENWVIRHLESSSSKLRHSFSSRQRCTA